MNVNVNKNNGGRSPLGVALLLALLILGGSVAGLLGVRGASAQTTGTINEPPVAPHLITAFPARDFVSAEGYDSANGPVTISVLRRDGSGGYTLISQAQNVMPNADGIAEVNHPGGACWEVVTPDIRVGDVVRVTTAAGSSDQTTVRNILTGAPVQLNATTVVIHGSAQDSNGIPLPIDQLGHRLINGDRFDNDRRTLRASAIEVEDGTFAYDAPGSVNWTATYANLSALDVQKAMQSESSASWLGASATEETIHEVGDAIAPGPQAPCTAPLEGAGPAPLPQPVPAAPAYNTLVEPPTTGREIVAFPERDFVTISGFSTGETVTINVLRNVTTIVNGAPVVSLVTVGAAQNIAPKDDLTTPGVFDGVAEVNHPGGYCWEGTTPDIRPGDIVRVTTASGVAEQTTVANIRAERPILVAPSTIEIHGYAIDAAGNPLPIDQIEQRMIGSTANSFDLSGNRSLRATGDGAEQGTLAYDAGSVNWKATYTNLSAADVTRVLDAESRIMWLGGNPAGGTELTIFEIGGEVAGGPQAPCSAAAEPRVVVNATPQGGLFGGVQTVTLTTNPVGGAIYYTTDGATPTAASIAYAGTITLNATTNLKFMAVDSVNFTEPKTSQVFMETYIIDSVPPATPSAPDMSAASDTGISSTDNITRTTTPVFNGTAEANTTVKLYVDGVERSSVNSGAGGVYSLTTTALSEGAHAVTARAFDFAGNASPVSAALSITIDTVNNGVNANPPGGSYSAAVSVTLSGETGARIYFTTNGTTPTTGSTLYTAPISVASTTTLRYFSVDVAGNQSAIAQQTYTMSPPAAPSLLVLSEAVRGQVVLNWTDNSTNETSFVVERSTTSATAGFTQIGTVGANVRTYTNAGVARRTTYYYRVRAVNGFGSSANTNTASIKTQ
jgi:hypothetical protein